MTRKPKNKKDLDALAIIVPDNIVRAEAAAPAPLRYFLDAQQQRDSLPGDPAPL